MKRRNFFGSLGAVFVKPSPPIPQLYRIPKETTIPPIGWLGSGGVRYTYEIISRAEVLKRYRKIPDEAHPVSGSEA